MGASESFGDLTEEQTAQWENEGGNTIGETKPEQKMPSHSLGKVFLQEQFLKALWAQTLHDRTVWWQIESSFQVPRGVYTETWETMVSGVRITLCYFLPIGIAGGFFKKGIKMGKEQVDMRLIHQEIIYGLNFSEVEWLSLQLHREIKDQHDRETRKWHSKHTDIDHPLDVSGFGDLLVSLTNTLSMKEPG